MPNFRSGAVVRVAIAFQSVAGTPVTTFDDADLMRFTLAPPAVLGIVVSAHRPTTGKFYEQSEVAKIRRRTPTLKGTVKAGPENVLLLVRSLLSVQDSGGDFDGSYKPNLPGDQLLTYVWDDASEAIRVTDLWVHAVKFRSPAREHLLIDVEGVGKKHEKLSPVLSDQVLANLRSYSHVNSTFSNDTDAADLAALNLEIELRQSPVVAHGNSLDPTFIGKGKEIEATFRLGLRLDDDGETLYEKILALSEADYTGEWTTDANKKLTIKLFNVTLQGDLPQTDEDAKLGDFIVTGKARLLGTQNPFSVSVEG